MWRWGGSADGQMVACLRGSVGGEGNGLLPCQPSCWSPEPTQPAPSLATPVGHSRSGHGQVAFSGSHSRSCMLFSVHDTFCCPVNKALQLQAAVGLGPLSPGCCGHPHTPRQPELCCEAQALGDGCTRMHVSRACPANVSPHRHFRVVAVPRHAAFGYC